MLMLFIIIHFLPKKSVNRLKVPYLNLKNQSLFVVLKSYIPKVENKDSSQSRHNSTRPAPIRRVRDLHIDLE